AGGDQDATRGYGEAPADQPVRDPAAEERKQPGAPGVKSPDVAGALVIETQPSAAARGDQEQDQDRLNAIVGEPLPHLREEEGREATRMTEQCRAGGGAASFGLRVGRTGCHGTGIDDRAHTVVCRIRKPAAAPRPVASSAAEYAP